MTMVQDREVPELHDDTLKRMTMQCAAIAETALFLIHFLISSKIYSLYGKNCWSFHSLRRFEKIQAPLGNLISFSSRKFPHACCSVHRDKLNGALMVRDFLPRFGLAYNEPSRVLHRFFRGNTPGVLPKQLRGKNKFVLHAREVLAGIQRLRKRKIMGCPEP